jgi:tetratricopeptide (TPR) repeat protein
MAAAKKDAVAQAATLWDQRDHRGLVRLAAAPTSATRPEVLYYAGLAYNALNKRREAIECWRKAERLKPDYHPAVRALAYELTDRDPVEASELLYRLYAAGEADADDLTSLAEIRIKQDRLGEAQRLLRQALELDKDNSLALLAMATLYAQVRGRDLALDYLKKAAQTKDVDLSDLDSDPEFEFLWHDKEFTKIVKANGRQSAR